MWAGRRVALATRHGKEQLLAPVLARLGLSLVHVSHVDTDAFGTFTGDVPRVGGPRAAAWRKIEVAFRHAPHCELAIASEGSFGLHPALPLMVADAELLVLASRDGIVSITVAEVTSETTFGQCEVVDVAQGLAAAEAFGFPSHGLVVGPTKGVRARRELEATLRAQLLLGPVTVSSDVRAHMNPTRQRVIARAAERLVARMASACPRCSWPGFGVTSLASGAPCEVCGSPTSTPFGERQECEACSFVSTRQLASSGEASTCPQCNP